MSIEDDIGPLVADKKVAEDLGICVRSLRNWEEVDPTFPPRASISTAGFFVAKKLLSNTSGP